MEIEESEGEEGGERPRNLITISVVNEKIIVSSNFETIDLDEEIGFKALNASFRVIFSPLEGDAGFQVDEGEVVIRSFNRLARFGFCNFMVEMSADGLGEPVGDPPPVNSDLDIQPLRA